MQVFQIMHFSGNTARCVFTKLDNIIISDDNNYGFKVVNVDIVDDATNFSDHLLVKWALHLQDVNRSSNQRRQTCDNNSNSQYFRYIWSDVAKQQYYISTVHMLQLLTADLNCDNTYLSKYEFVNSLYNGIVGVLKNCSAAYYKSFIQKPCNTYSRGIRESKQRCIERLA